MHNREVNFTRELIWSDGMNVIKYETNKKLLLFKLPDNRIKPNENLKQHHVEVMACMHGSKSAWVQSWEQCNFLKERWGRRADRTEGRFQVYIMFTFKSL